MVFLLLPCLFYLLIYLLLAVLGLAGFSLVVSGGYPLAAVGGLLIVMASPVVESGLSACRLHSYGMWVQWLWLPDSRAKVQKLEHRLGCSEACGIFPDQGLNPCLLHWQADSLPLSHQGSLDSCF